MGASTFFTVADGKTAQEAFRGARERAAHEDGHGGYTGTIAEKRDFVMMGARPMALADAQALAERAIDEADARIDDKWGPAGCIGLTDGRFYFFGWASS